MKWYEVESRDWNENAQDWGEFLNWIDDAIEADSPEEALKIYKEWMQDNFVKACDVMGKANQVNEALERLWQTTDFRVKEAEMRLEFESNAAVLKTVCGNNVVIYADYWEIGVEIDDDTIGVDPDDWSKFDDYIEQKLGYLPDYTV